MKTQNYIDPYDLADHCESMINETVLQILRDQLYELYPDYTNEDPNYEDNIINQAFSYLITAAYKHETNNYDGKNW